MSKRDRTVMTVNRQKSITAQMMKCKFMKQREKITHIEKKAWCKRHAHSNLRWKRVGQKSCIAKWGGAE